MMSDPKPPVPVPWTSSLQVSPHLLQHIPTLEQDTVAALAKLSAVPIVRGSPVIPNEIHPPSEIFTSSRPRPSPPAAHQLKRGLSQDQGSLDGRPPKLERSTSDSSQVYSRKEKSLGLLCENFLKFYGDGKQDLISLDAAASQLGVERRRIYDIVNVLESVEIVVRKAKNRYTWYGRTRLPQALRRLREEALEEKHRQETRRSSMGRSSSACSYASRASSVSSLDDDAYGTPAGASHDEDSFHGSVADGDERDDESFLGVTGLKTKLASRREKSLGILSQKFVQMFLVSGNDIVTLEQAGRKLLGTSDNTKLKTKVRRLYDIANILSSLNLIEKIQLAESRKPAFKWIGVDLCPLSDKEEEDEEGSPPAHDRPKPKRRRIENDHPVDPPVLKWIYETSQHGGGSWKIDEESAKRFSEISSTGPPNTPFNTDWNSLVSQYTQTMMQLCRGWQGVQERRSKGEVSEHSVRYWMQCCMSTVSMWQSMLMRAWGEKQASPGGDAPFPFKMASEDQARMQNMFRDMLQRSGPKDSCSSGPGEAGSVSSEHWQQMASWYMSMGMGMMMSQPAQQDSGSVHSQSDRSGSSDTECASASSQ
eukprot:Rmarinus@m.12835